MKIINFSKSCILSDHKTDDPINLITQFYIDANPARQNEIRTCLKTNYENPFVDKIYLLNERIYTLSELGVTNQTGKIVQINIQFRLKYQDVFDCISKHEIKGYNIFMNSDILLDDSIQQLRYTDIHLNKKMFALVRYEYDPTDILKSKLFTRFDSQDTWIIHSNYNIPLNIQKIFNFPFGKPGCDNKLIYLMNILNYEIYNEPRIIKTYHYHTSQIRNYTKKDVIKEPWGFVVPSNIHYTKFQPSLGIDLSVIATKTNNFNDLNFNDNSKLSEFVLSKLEMNTPFIIPCVSGIENNMAFIGDLFKHNKSTEKHFKYITNNITTMKMDAGIKLTELNSVMNYSQTYLEAFENCEIYFSLEPYGNYYNQIAQSIEYIKNKYNKTVLWQAALDIYHYIFSVPWTHALKGKKVLIISPFEKSIIKQLQYKTEIYGIDLFPECVLSTICPPQTEGNKPSDDFTVELDRFTSKLDTMDYDIALVSCGGYGNLVCNYIFNRGKSAIYVGKVLQTYFGILDNRLLLERSDIIRLFLNEFWTNIK